MVYITLKNFGKMALSADRFSRFNLIERGEISIFIKVKNLRKDFKLGKNSISILKGINLNIEQGEMVAILGPSGSGKSTFLNVLGEFVPPTSVK